MAKCNQLFQDKQLEEVEAAYQQYLKEVESPLAMSFDEFCEHYAIENSARD